MATIARPAPPLGVPARGASARGTSGAIVRRPTGGHKPCREATAGQRRLAKVTARHRTRGALEALTAKCRGHSNLGPLILGRRSEWSSVGSRGPLLSRESS